MKIDTKFAIIAALPRELAALTGRLRPDAELTKRGIFLYRLGSAVAVAAGMGEDRAALGVEAALAVAPAAMLISAGLAGSCSPAVCAGEAREAGVVIDTQTGERFATDAAAGDVLASSHSIANVAEKARLAATYGAKMVDMEAATVGRLALARGLRFRAIKGISDGHDFELESLAEFGGRFGQFRTAAFGLHVALHPEEWRRAARLARGSQIALAAMTERLREIIEA